MVVTVITVLVIAASFFGEAIFGFGGGLVSVPLLSLMMDVKEAVTLVLIFQLCMGLLIFKSYKHINWHAAKPMTWGVIIGTFLGTLWLSSASTKFLQLFLAMTILVFLIKSVRFKNVSFGNKDSSLAAGAAGLGGGFFTGLIGTGGPVLTMYLVEVVPKKLQMRATLIYLFFLTGIVRISMAVPEHLFTHHVLHLAAIAAVPFLIAIYIGQGIHHKVSEQYYRLSINVILALSSLLLLIKAL